MRLLLLGNSGIEHVGSHFREAAAELQTESTFVDAQQASDGPFLLRQLNWRLRGHRPNRLGATSSMVLNICRETKPDLLLTTGFAPINQSTLEEIGALRIRRANYLTDDPWNARHRAPWFLRALTSYDHVFSPRQANIEDLKAAGCHNVQYLPFAFAPHIHFPVTIEEREREQLASDVIFAGGGDSDRAPYIGALHKAGFRIALYGGYWDRFPETKGLSRGMADLETLRKAMAASNVALCLVRRQNRDGHSMRTFEGPAFGACMLVEETEEHKELFGPDGKTVAYFDGIPRMIERMRWLLANPAERCRLASAAHALVVGGGNSYRNRLLSILESVACP